MITLDLIHIFKWWLTLFLIGSSFIPLTSRIFDKFIDKGYLFSKVIGLLVISYLIYVSSSVHLLKFTTLNILIISLILAISLWTFFRIKILSKKQLLIFICEEFIFIIAIIIWSSVRGFQPAIHDLEKFMDFGFLNSILRADFFPPKDMWFTPLPINYYYFGHLFTAVLTKISTVPSYISFNLMIATIFAFSFSLSFSLGINLIINLRKSSKLITVISGFIIAFFVSLSGNLQTVYSLFKGYHADSPVPFWNLPLSLNTFPNSYWYPNATRFIFHTIHEFPSYSFVVADLHGHVLDIPIVLTLIGIFIHTVINKVFRKYDVFLISFLLTIAYMTNAWDGIIYFGLFLLISLIIFFSKITILDRNTIYKFLIDIVINKIILFGVLFFIFSFIFNSNFSPFASGIGLNCAPDLLIKIHRLGPFIFESGKCSVSPIWQLGILYGFFVFMLSSFLIFMRKKQLNQTDLIALCFSLFSLILIIFPEIFYLKDIYEGYFRANTMFKLTYQAFILFSIASGYFLIRILLSIRETKNSKSRLYLYSFLLPCVVLLFFVSIYPYFSIPSGYGYFKEYKGLNGIKYLQEIKPYDYEAINWINQNIKGQPIILEAQGDSYTDFGRISANTGLPTVLGWTVHEWLWRGSYDVPASRFDDIKNLYETASISAAKTIIDKYKISYVYIGVLEKDKYKINESKFKKLGNIIYTNQGSTIYKLN